MGRILRVALGVYLLLIGIPFFLFPGQSVSFLGNTYSSDYSSMSLALTTILAFFVFYLIVHRASTGPLRNLNAWGGAILANAPPLGVFILSSAFGYGFSQIAVFVYVGGAMLLAGWRRDMGCEVMSPANAVLGESTHFACLIFSPVDWAEKRSRTQASRESPNSYGPQLSF